MSSEARADRRILWVTADADESLLTSDGLSEYDAIVVDQLIGLWGVSPDAPTPGFERELESTAFTALGQSLVRKGREALDLLGHGGIVVIRLYPLSALKSPVRNAWIGEPSVERITSADWWLVLDERLQWMKTHRPDMPLISASSGSVIKIAEPGHLLEDYVRSSRYTAVLDRIVAVDPSVHVLATNRGGEPIAIEKAVGAGLLIVIPSDGPIELLSEGLAKLLDLRRGLLSDWRLPVEERALADLQVIEERFRQEHRLAQERLVEIDEAKRQVMSDPTIRRAVGSYRAATSPGNSRRVALANLYSVVELVQTGLGGETMMISVLGVTKGTVNSIKRPANDPSHQARHVSADATSDISDASMEDALRAAHKILLSYIEWRYSSGGSG